MPSMKNENPLVPAAAGDQPESFPLPVVTDRAPALVEQKQWRSLAELGEDASLAESKQDEFPKDATFFDAVDRRGFLQILGGGAALAGMAACWRPPDENIYPYTKAPEGTPGVNQHYATAIAFGGYGTGVVATSYDGRPIKIDGNVLHPSSRGTSSYFEQAALYRLYDPHRLKQIVRNGTTLSWRNYLVELGTLIAAHKKDGGQKLRFLVGPTSSPTLAALRGQVRQQLGSAKFYTWEPVALHSSRQATQAAFGQPAEVSYDLANADVIVSLDSDFLMWEPERLKLNKQFADRRVPENGMNRLYVVEPSLSVTGTNADHRLRVKPSEVLAVAKALAAALAGSAQELGQFGGAQVPEKAQKFVQAVAKDLAGKRGRSLVIAGNNQPAQVHALAFAINQALGNVGQTVNVHAPVLVDADESMNGFTALAKEIEAGQVDTLVIDAYNPVYTAPADVDFAALLKKVKNTIYFTYYQDETAQVANWLVPEAHELESWGDLRGTDGTVALVQPVIAPLFAGIPAVAFWGAFTGQGEKSSMELVRATWASKAADAAQFAGEWRKLLADGVIPATAEQPTQAQVNMGGVSTLMQQPQAQVGGLELHIVPDYKVVDGSFSNNPWLKELPNPVTKVTWDNVAIVSPATAKAHGIEQGDVLKLTARNKTVEAPAYVLPGQADDVVTVSLGYGRKSAAEQVANQYGFDAYQLRFSDQPHFVGGLKLEKTGRQYRLAITQDHNSMEGRDIALMADLSETEKLKEAVSRNRDTITQDQVMQQPVDYSAGYKWGMAVDMSRCTACNACVIACQAENNIPIVGKDQVWRAREMHWIMVDRYFVGEDINEPQVAAQPRFCVHCETAPCEYVCPVNATVHSDEGLNDMVYNRCVGTRYCSNNCPYKVRRFNYLHFSGGKSAPEKMMMNPDVTVRQRGVMEKCTYCVQRIERARISTRIEGRQIKEGDIVTACQQACPTEALVFGNLNDPSAKVTKLHQDARRYDLLYSIGTRPRTVHLARIKNQNPELAAPHKAGAEEHH